MRYNLQKIIPAIVLAAMLLSMAPIGAPVAYAEPESFVGMSDAPTGQNVTPNQQTTSAASVSTLGKVPTKENIDTEITCNSLNTCLILLVYYVGPALAGNVAYIGAYFFSIVVQLSLNSTAYALDFLSTGWTTVRDIANMAFIFILIYIALTVMLAAETSGTIKTLAVVIVIALLVNFSFFFTRVVIDAGNIVAVQFYNAIPYQGPIGNGNDTKDLSLSIMNAINPQELLNSAMLDRVRAATGSNWGAVGVYIVLFLSVATMFWILFFAFLQVGIKFMMRIVGLWFVLIASPLAFVAKTMKQTSHFFDQWLDYLIKFSFYPAIFLFMFWILTKFTTSILSSGTGGVGNGSLMNSLFNTPTGTSVELGTMAVIATVMIRMGFVVAVLYVGLKVSDWIVKEGSAVASKMTGWSTGKALGTVGFAGRNSVGWAGRSFAQSNAGRFIGSRGGILGRTLVRGSGALGRGSFDARNVKAVNKTLGVLGGDVDLKTGKTKPLDFGKGTGEGGYAASFDKRIEAREKEAKQYKPSETQLKDAMKEEVKKLNPADRMRVEAASENYARTQRNYEEGTADRSQLAGAKAAFDAETKTIIEAAKTRVGYKDPEKYADSLDKRKWNNAWKAHRLFFRSAADNEAANKIRSHKNDGDRLQHLMTTL